MIIWINGAFGSGKTAIAFELYKRLDGSFIFDPENFGYYMRKNLPKALLSRDFQDEPLWREVNYKMLKKLHSGYLGNIIVPMTIANIDYFDEIIGRLRMEGIRVDHYLLEAGRTTLLKRLKKRLDGKNSWPAKQVDRCLKAFEADSFDIRIPTDNMRFKEITDFIGFIHPLRCRLTMRAILKSACRIGSIKYDISDDEDFFY